MNANIVAEFGCQNRPENQEGLLVEQSAESLSVVAARGRGAAVKDKMVDTAVVVAWLATSHRRPVVFDKELPVVKFGLG